MVEAHCAEMSVSVLFCFFMGGDGTDHCLGMVRQWLGWDMWHGGRS